MTYKNIDYTCSGVINCGFWYYIDYYNIIIMYTCIIMSTQCAIIITILIFNMFTVWCSIIVLYRAFYCALCHYYVIVYLCMWSNYSSFVLYPWSSFTFHRSNSTVYCNCFPFSYQCSSYCSSPRTRLPLMWKVPYLLDTLICIVGASI